MIRAALIGNPNVGKTEVFNRLTGLSQKVGNFPGVTVEKKVGKLVHGNVEIEVVDLPGTYSLNANAVDELVARDYITQEKPEIIVDIVDAANLERNLYLTLLLIEMDLDLVIALNRWDTAESRGIRIDPKKLSELLGCPVVPTVAVSGQGLDNLKDSIVDASGAAHRTQDWRKVEILDYGSDLELLIGKVEDVIRESPALIERYPKRWLAIRMLEGDEIVMEQTKAILSSNQQAIILGIIESGEAAVR
jgi:ferrous iron transport protein B